MSAYELKGKRYGAFTLKAYTQQISFMTYEFNMDHDVDIKTIAKAKCILIIGL